LTDNSQLTKAAKLEISRGKEFMARFRVPTLYHQCQH